MGREGKVRNYSFRNSKRLPEKNMTEIGSIKIPSMPGSCYHAILCALAVDKDRFCRWDKIIEQTEKYMRQYGGRSAWEKFCSKSNVKSYQQRIKDNAHTLTRTGKDCYGFRLHERGLAIYYFKDGAMMVTGGKFAFKQKGDEITGYDVVFPDGRMLQKRYRGTTMTYNEYKNFYDLGYIDASGGILNAEGIRRVRSQKPVVSQVIDNNSSSNGSLQVSVTLDENYDQNTANRLEAIGFIVEQHEENELIGLIGQDRFPDLENDVDVLEVIKLDH